MILRQISVAVAVSVLFSCQSVRGDAVSNALIDWSRMTVQVQDLSGGSDAPVLEWTSHRSRTWANALTRDPFDFKMDEAEAFDGVTTVSAAALTAQAQAQCWNNPASILAASAKTQRAYTLSSGDYNLSNGDGDYLSDFTFSGKGLLLITVPWSVSVTGAVDDWDDFCNAGAYVTVTYTDGAFIDGEVSSGGWLSSDEDGPSEVSDVFSMAILNLGGGRVITGSLLGEVYTQSFSWNEVPEPASCILFGVGLVAFGSVSYWRRRR
jgi:hypothetical protein